LSSAAYSTCGGDGRAVSPKHRPIARQTHRLHAHIHVLSPAKLDSEERRLWSAPDRVCRVCSWADSFVLSSTCRRLPP
jgi:hypothetical protein